MITIEDFSKIEMKIGEILSVERVPETDKLLKLKVDFGLKKNMQKQDTSFESLDNSDVKEEKDVRQVISGIAEFFDDYEALVGVKCPFVTNLEPRTIRGLVSEAMIMAVHTEDGKFSILEPNVDDIPAGAKLN